MRLASRFGRYNSIRRERPLTDDELMQFVPSVFSGDKHESRSERYTYIPTINIINKLRDEGFQPFFACQSRIRDLGRREYSKHMLRLRREGHINGQEVPEIILLNFWRKHQRMLRMTTTVVTAAVAVAVATEMMGDFT